MQRKHMSKGRRQVLAPAPVPHRTTRATLDAPTTGFFLVVDGQMKEEFKTPDAARKRAEALKHRFPALQVRIFDAEAKRTETVERLDA